METTTLSKWSGIEYEELDSENWIQLAYRHNKSGTRIYWVSGKLKGESFNEHYDSDSDDNKRLAYSLYWDKMEQF